MSSIEDAHRFAVVQLPRASTLDRAEITPGWTVGDDPTLQWMVTKVGEAFGALYPPYHSRSQDYLPRPEGEQLTDLRGVKVSEVPLGLQGRFSTLGRQGGAEAQSMYPVIDYRAAAGEATSHHNPPEDVTRRFAAEAQLTYLLTARNMATGQIRRTSVTGSFLVTEANVRATGDAMELYADPGNRLPVNEAEVRQQQQPADYLDGCDLSHLPYERFRHLQPIDGQGSMTIGGQNIFAAETFNVIEENIALRRPR